MLHHQVAPLAPFGGCDVPQPGGDQHQSRLPVGESSDDSSSPSDLADDPLQRVVGSDLTPVRARVSVVGQRL